MWWKGFWTARYWHDRFWPPVSAELPDNMEDGAGPATRRRHGPPDTYRDYTLAMYNEHVTELLLRAVK